jgi:phosphoglycerate dehydrogenase-like enzyme
MTAPDRAPGGASGAGRAITRFATDFPFGADDRARLSAALGEGRLLAVHSREALVQALAELPDTDVICPLLDLHGLPDTLPHVRWIALASAGADHALDSPQAHGVNPPIVTTANGVHAIPISEHVFSAILQHSRKWRELGRLQLERAWPNSILEKAVYAGRELQDAKLLVIGLGAIGRRVAQLGHAFGMRVLGVRRSVAAGADDTDVDVLASADDLDALLPQADYIVIAAPSTDATRGMISAARLALMKPDAMLVNIARGDIIDEPALIEALRGARLGAAALDVTEREPLPSDDPLWSAPNLYLSPHVSGLTPLYSQRLTDIMLDNFSRYRDGRPMRNLVQAERGY